MGSTLKTLLQLVELFTPDLQSLLEVINFCPESDELLPNPSRFGSFALPLLGAGLAAGRSLDPVAD